MHHSLTYFCRTLNAHWKPDSYKKKFYLHFFYTYLLKWLLTCTITTIRFSEGFEQFFNCTFGLNFLNDFKRSKFHQTFCFLFLSHRKKCYLLTHSVLYRHNFYHSLSSKVTLEINLTSTFAAKIGPKNSFLLYSKILFIALNIDWDFHIFLSPIMKFKQPAKKKKRMQGKHDSYESQEDDSS